MKQIKCKPGKLGLCSDYGTCDDCEINQMIVRYEKKLQEQKELYNCALRMFEDFSEVNSALLSYRLNFMLQGAQEFAKELKAKAFQGYQVGMYIVSTQMIDEALEEYRKR